jgi:hypothetical protein
LETKDFDATFRPNNIIVRHRLIPEVTVPEPLERITVPDDLIPLGDAEIQELHDKVLASFKEVNDLGPGNYAQDDISYAFSLRDGLSKIKAEMSARKVRADQQAAAERLSAERTMKELSESINGPAEGTPEAAEHTARTELEHDEAIAAAAARGVTDAFVKLMGERRGTSMTQVTERAVATLGQTAKVAPKVAAPPAKLPITAAGTGNEIPNVTALAQAFISKASDVPVTSLGREAPRHKVASIRNEFPYTGDNRTSPFVIQEYLEAMRDEALPALTAGGGWCAPNEIKYDFFNIAEAPLGTIDLPTIGVQRGGLQWPVSPAIGDVFFQAGGSNPASGFGGFAFTFANTSDPWLWSEADDQATVTGSVNKPTLRVPCSSFTSGRLEAYGLTLTAGNLTDSAYPEQTQNFLRLLRAAYAHAINARLISLMDTAAGGATTVGAVTTDGPSARIPSAMALAATDYRARYAMRTDAVLEVVIPYWVREVIRADLALRNSFGTDLLAVPDSAIDALFNVRNVRIQWVDDYQVRSANFGTSSAATTWPATVNFLMYAAGTFLHGQGMSLDLGVVRDSVLNAENDFTAAWAEETHMIALVGHAARKYTCAFFVSGQVGGAVATPNGAHV